MDPGALIYYRNTSRNIGKYVNKLENYYFVYLIIYFLKMTESLCTELFETLEYGFLKMCKFENLGA